MFDLPPRSGSTEQPKTRATPSMIETCGLSTLNEAELVRLRAEIDKTLPVKALRDLNIERELVLQLITVQHLQSEVLGSDSIPANQQAQTANTVAAALSTLLKLQNEVYTSERLKRIEQALIECLQTLPSEAQEAFFAVYEAELGKLDRR